MRPSRALVLVTAAGLAAGLCAVAADSAAAAPAPRARASAGAAGDGDSYFPRQGNGGYDVSSYRLGIGYTPRTKKLTGHAVIAARATKALSRFDLDLRRNLIVSRVTVDGRVARFSQPASQVQELVITPAKALASGHRFRIGVVYAGKAKAAIDPDGALDGFIPTDDGAFVASEPQGAPTWYPVNDTPRDKAAYAVTVTVPKGLTAVSNGAYLGKRDHGGLSIWRWNIATPISSYLVTATIGKFNVTKGHTPGGLPYFVAVDPTQAAKSKAVVAKMPDIIDFFSKKYGKYPFGWAGAIIDNAPQVGYALETATRPVFDRAPDLATFSHEFAHQWFGDDVTLARWRDIWVNEGFAEFSSWLYDEHTGGRSTAQHLDDLLAIPASKTDEWNPPPGNPGSADNIFASSVYDRGAGTLAALREKLGDARFFLILRGWLSQHRQGNATVAQFTAYAERVAARDLTPFFTDWLYDEGKPDAS